MIPKENEIQIEEYADFELQQTITNYIQTMIPQDMYLAIETTEKITQIIKIYIQTVTRELLKCDELNGYNNKEIKPEYIEACLNFPYDNKIVSIKQQITRKYFELEGD